MNSIAILAGAMLFGMVLHYLKRAFFGELWKGDTEPNPFKAQFWTDLRIYMFEEHVGRTCGAVVTAIGTAFVLGQSIGIDTASIGTLITTGAAAGFIGDSFNKANPS